MVNSQQSQADVANKLKSIQKLKRITADTNDDWADVLKLSN